jgi:hypothetical protein
MKTCLRVLSTTARFLLVSLFLTVPFLLIFTGCDKSSGDVNIPVNLKGADGIGSLHLELVFDPAVIKAVGLKTGDLAEYALVEHNLQVPGRVIIGLADHSGISGDGVLVEISFEVMSKNGKSQLILENVEAYDTEYFMNVIAEISNGNFSVEDKEFIAPVIAVKS